ncbi:MAG: TraB/GumN family protein [Burkholderiales bacterium]|nr:TraB/GumN family protein [Burkholderiales bacterium]
MCVWALRAALAGALGGALDSALAAPACPPPPAAPGPAQWREAARHDRGFLWSIERDGRTSYLYGSLHVGRPQWQRPGPRVAAALAASDVLALELDPANPEVAQALASDAGARAPEWPAALRERLARQVAAACLPEGALARMAPALQLMVLEVLQARWAGLDPAYAQESVLASAARAAGRPVRALETAALQKKALMADADPGQAAQALDELADGSARRQIERMASVWEHGDYARLARYAQWCGCADTEAGRAALRALNDDRNPGLADGIEALAREGRRVFAAVGSLHMVGPRGLPALLAARGFTVRRIAFEAPVQQSSPNHQGD